MAFILILDHYWVWLFALAKDVYPDAALMRTSSGSDATSGFAVRESYMLRRMKTIPRMTPHLRSLGDSFCGDGELHLYSALGGSV